MNDKASLAGAQTRELAEFASSLSYADIPSDTIEHAKLSVLDTLGCSLFGSTLPWLEVLRGTVLREGATPLATLLGSSERVSMTQAALVNATAAHSFEFDDIHMGGMFHPGALTLSASLAVGEQRHISGATLLTAIVAGDEVGARVGKSVGIAHFSAGFHPQGTVGVFAAAASAGRALSLDADALQHALGIAGSRSSGLMAAQEGSMVKRLHSGFACESGVRATLLASEGFTGIMNVLEADFGGFASAMGGGNVQLDELTSGLLTRWETNDIGFKPYASCAAAQSSIEVAKHLRDELTRTNSVPVAVTVHSSTHSMLHCGWEYAPNGVTAAQMSIPYGVACMLLYGEVSAKQFSDQAIANPAAVDLAKRVMVVGDETIDALGPTLRYTVRIEIATSDGRILNGAASDRPGGPTQPMTTEEVQRKFRSLVTPLLGRESTERLEETVDSLEKIGDVSTVISQTRLETNPI
jgi:2-methylcitrate dehydratase PrpD